MLSLIKPVKTAQAYLEQFFLHMHSAPFSKSQVEELSRGLVNNFKGTFSRHELLWRTVLKCYMILVKSVTLLQSEV